MCTIELITLLLDFIGLLLISWNIFSLPKPVKFTFNQEYGVIVSLQDVENAINAVSRNFELIKRMRYGFYFLIVSLVLKLINWYISRG